MTDPNNIPTPTSTPPTPSDPQELIDQALGGATSPAPTPTPLTNEVVEPIETSTEPVTPPAPIAQPEVPPNDVVMPRGEDVPLAFMASAPVDAAPTQAVPNTTEDIPPAIVPPTISAPPASDTPKPPKKGKIIALVAGFFLLIGVLGTVAYNTFGDAVTIAGVTIGKNGRPSEIDDPGDCNGESNGGWLVWRNGACKVTGISGNTVDTDGDGVGGDKNTVNPNITNASNEDGCEKSGGFWCTGNDASGKPYAFCGSNTSGKACYQQASDKGITVSIGKIGCECTKFENGLCVSWGLDDATLSAINLNNTTSGPTKTKAITDGNANCNTYKGNFSGTGSTVMWICPVGTSVACTENVAGARRFYGNQTGCFCGVVQVDTGSGHQSYSSTCGCDKTNPEPSTPTITTNPTLMCNTLTKTPTTAPTIGSTLTFTCAGSSTPTGSVSLSYKFRYSLNSGAYVNLNNTTATTANMTIAACGSYKVQCQACGTINGVLTCDPTWVAATQ